MYGMLFSIKSFVNKISPIDPKEGFLFYKTSKYALHFLETAAGLKFVINTDTTSTGVKDFLQQLYAKVFRTLHLIGHICVNIYIILPQVWVDYVVRNPLWQPGTTVTSELFKTKLDEYIKQSPLYGIKHI